MLKEDPLNKHYTSYNFGTGGSYGMIQHFFSQDRDQVLELAKKPGYGCGISENRQRLLHCPQHDGPQLYRMGNFGEPGEC